jgi:hypothetical protein
MNDVLPKPFTKDSLLGMLEKHLLHMKQMQQLQQGYNIPAPLKAQRLLELPEDQQPSTSTAPSQPALPDPINIEDPNLQFSYDQNYTAIFGPSAPTAQPVPTFTQQSPTSPTGKRRQASDHGGTYEFHGQPRAMPRSSGVQDNQSQKRVRYNTPPW